VSVWANFRKKAEGIPWDPFFQTPLYFLDTDRGIFKIHYKDCTFIWLKDI
jgi:hypothetical protein